MTQSYKTQTIKNLSKLEVGKWYQINTRPDYKDLLKLIEWMISQGIRYEISENRNNIRLSSSEYRMEAVEKGYSEEITIKGIKYPLVHESGSYQTFRGEKLIGIGR